MTAGRTRRSRLFQGLGLVFFFLITLVVKFRLASLAVGEGGRKLSLRGSNLRVARRVGNSRTLRLPIKRLRDDMSGHVAAELKDLKKRIEKLEKEPLQQSARSGSAAPAGEIFKSGFVNSVPPCARCGSPRPVRNLRLGIYKHAIYCQREGETELRWRCSAGSQC